MMKNFEVIKIMIFFFASKEKHLPADFPAEETAIDKSGEIRQKMQQQ